MWDYSFLVSSALVLLTICAFYFSKPRLPVHANRTFLFLLVVQVLVIFLDGVSSRIDERYALFPLWVVYAANIAYFVLYLVRSYWFYRFTMRVVHVGVHTRAATERLFDVPFILAECLAASSFATGAVFFIGPDGYHSGPFYNVLYACGLFYIGLSVVQLLRNAHRLRRYELDAALAYNAALLVGNVVRFLMPRLLIMDTFCTVAITIVFIGFMNPDLFTTDRGPAYNKRGFRLVLSEAVRDGDYHVLGIALQHYYHERGMLGGAQIDEVIASVNEWLARGFPGFVPFYLSAGRFALVGDTSTDWSAVRERVSQRFEEPWDTPDGPLHLGIVFVQMSSGSGLDTADKIVNNLTIALESAQQDSGLAGAESLGVREVDQQVGVLRALERAIEDDTVEVFLQPVIDARSGRVISAEALARIRDEQGNIVSPGLFIPMAEHTGHIARLGEQVLNKTCAFVAGYDMAALGLQWINVNLSPLQCVQHDLAERFAHILAQNGVQPSFVHLEITEQSMVDYTLLSHQIDALQALGFTFSLDDYGTGYSNLMRLRHYPFDNIKLDMEVVWDYFRERDSLLPVAVHAYREAGYTITAEGIESEEMAAALSDIGADYLQGFVYSQPLPMDEFVRRYAHAGSVR